MTMSAAVSQAPAYDARNPEAPARGATRIASLDFVRGVVMILMAIDHVRVYSGVPAGGPTYGVFFTRWITHFVAPGFAFFAGTAAYLHGRRIGGRAALSKFLFTRGLWLVVLELTFLRLAWTFNLDFANYNLAGVIWMLGICMMLMAAAVWLPTVAIGAIGVGIMALHNLTDVFRPQLVAALGDGGPGWLLEFLYFGGYVPVGHDGPPILILYVIVPWIGVMMAGYAFGAVMELPAERRRALLLKLGAAMAVAFVALRALDGYGDPRPWRGGGQAPAVIRFLGTTKYPASLDFLLMTLGPLFILLALAERWRGRAAGVVTTYGRVPLFYYVLHIALIHAAACLVSLAREGSVNPWLFGNHPLAPPDVPPGYRWSLGLLYLVWALCVAALYVPCRWYAGVRARTRSKWLSYL